MKPSISDGSVMPAAATVEYEASYEVTCDVGFTISGSTTMTCGADGTFDKTPICQGNRFFNCSIVVENKIDFYRLNKL